MADVHIEECNAELVGWMQEHDRPKHMVHDDGFARFINKIQSYPGMYEAPSKQEVNRGYIRRGEKGRMHAKEWLVRCKAQGRKVSIAGDIWQDGDISILAICGYAVLEEEGAGEDETEMEYEEEVLAVVEFDKLKHTGACSLHSPCLNPSLQATISLP